MFRAPPRAAGQTEPCTKGQEAWVGAPDSAGHSCFLAQSLPMLGLHWSICMMGDGTP